LKGGPPGGRTARLPLRRGLTKFFKPEIIEILGGELVVSIFPHERLLPIRRLAVFGFSRKKVFRSFWRPGGGNVYVFLQRSSLRLGGQGVGGTIPGGHKKEEWFWAASCGKKGGGFLAKQSPPRARRVTAEQSEILCHLNS